jgi:hypothetical protein
MESKRANLFLFERATEGPGGSTNDELAVHEESPWRSDRGSFLLGLGTARRWELLERGRGPIECSRSAVKVQ